MHTNSRKMNIQSFIHGALTPVPGMNALEKQISIELAESAGTSTMRFFAIGHLITAYSGIIVVGYLLYTFMEMVQV